MIRALASSLFAIVVVAAAALPARADKVQQAQQLWQIRCAGCHVVGQGKPAKGVPHNFTDLTMATRDHDDSWLRNWILSPHAIKPDARCFTVGLEARQIDLLLAFLRAHAQPPQKHTIAAAKFAPPRPPDPPKEETRGLVRGR